MSLKDRINECLKEKGVKKVELAEATNSPRATVSDWTSGKTKSLSGEKLVLVAKYFNVEPLWMETGKGRKRTHKQNTINDSQGRYSITQPENTLDGPAITNSIPLISWIQAGSWRETVDNLHPGDAEEWIPTTGNMSPNSYALRVIGDSMTNPYGSPSIPNGYIIIIDPEQQANNGDLVVARLDDSMEATFKKLVIDGPNRYLKPLNPAYPVIEINGNCTICGKVVRVQWEP